jgi:hypothetical protein
MTHHRPRPLALSAAALAMLATCVPLALAAGVPAPEDIHDIRGPIAIPYWWLRPALVAGALALLLLGLATYRLLRRRAGVRGRSAAELALERIEQARALVGSGRAAEFSEQLSNAVRAYVEARFGLRAAHKTTEEFLQDLLASRSSPIAGHGQALDEFLSWCDLAKFARFSLSAEQMDGMTAAARRFVETTEAAAHETRPPPPTPLFTTAATPRVGS